MNKKRISIILSGLLMMTMVSCTNKDNISISLEDNKARVIENIQVEGQLITLEMKFKIYMKKYYTE